MLSYGLRAVCWGNRTIPEAVANDSETNTTHFIQYIDEDKDVLFMCTLSMQKSNETQLWETNVCLFSIWIVNSVHCGDVTSILRTKSKCRFSLFQTIKWKQWNELQAEEINKLPNQRKQNILFSIYSFVLNFHFDCECQVAFIQRQRSTSECCGNNGEFRTKRSISV